MKAIHYGICSVLTVMNFQLQLQAKFEAKSGYFIPAPSSVGFQMPTLTLESPE